MSFTTCRSSCVTFRPPEIIFGGLMQGLGGGLQAWTMLTLVKHFAQWEERSSVSTGTVRPPQGQETHFYQNYPAVSNHQKHSRALSVSYPWVGGTLNPHLGIRCLGLRDLGMENDICNFCFLCLLCFRSKMRVMSQTKIFLFLSWVKVQFATEPETEPLPRGATAYRPEGTKQLN